MAKPYRLDELEKTVGEPLDSLIPRIVNEKGSQKVAAKALNVAESTVSLWLRQNGYTVKKQWVKCSGGGAA